MTIKLDLKNKIINGSLDYWQRGVSFAAIANNIYHADRFHYIKTGAMVHTISRSADKPTSAFGVYSMLVDCTTIDSSIAAGDYAGVLQHIEGNVLRSFKGKKMVLNFWVKATKTGTYCVALRNGTSTRAYIMEYTVSASNTWEKKTLRFAHDVTGTWSYDNGIGLTAVWMLACGSTFQTSANAWVNGNFLATANQVNACDNVANDFYLSDICMVEDNEGQTRDPEFQLAGRDIFEELQLCQRYYETGTTDGLGQGPSSFYWRSGLFSVAKRVAPTISSTFISGVGTTSYTPLDTQTFSINLTGGLANSGNQSRYRADAEL